MEKNMDISFKLILEGFKKKKVFYDENYMINLIQLLSENLKKQEEN